MGIWSQKDVLLTSMRHDDVESTLIRRHFKTCRWGSSEQLGQTQRSDQSSSLIRVYTVLEASYIIKLSRFKRIFTVMILDISRMFVVM